MEKNAKVNVLIHNLEWKIPTTQAIGWHPIVEAIPSNSNPKMGQKDEIVWLDSPNHRFSVKVAWEQLRIHHQMVEWHGVVQECNQDIRFFYGWLSNKNSQLKIDFVGLVYMVPIDAHFVSATMKITTTCSFNAPILKRSGGMFVTDVTFQE